MPNVTLLNNVDALCTPRQLGAVIGLTSRSIDSLVLEGVFKPVRSGKLRGRHYPLRDSVQRYVAYQKKSVRAQLASRNGDGYSRARERRMAALALIEEMRAKQLSGEFLSRTRIVHVMTTLLSQVRNHVLGIPSRCSRQLIGQKDLQKVRSILDDACRGCLIEASTFNAKSFDETSKNEAHSDDS
jgi:phage terminase Nu1 subunit (DNA packaging protein)